MARQTVQQTTTKATKVLAEAANHLGTTNPELIERISEARNERLDAETREAYLAIKAKQRGVV